MTFTLIIVKNMVETSLRPRKFHHIRRELISRGRQQHPSRSIDSRRRSQICARSHNRRLYRASSEETTRSGEPASVLSDNSKYYDVQNAPDAGGRQIPSQHVICLRCILSYNRSLLPHDDENEHLPGTYTCRSFV